jgi:hypothetical protein
MRRARLTAVLLCVAAGAPVIDVIDATSRQLVWRGSGSRAVSRNPTPEQTTAVIDEAVRSILAQFPPQSSG